MDAFFFLPHDVHLFRKLHSNPCVLCFSLTLRPCFKIQIKIWDLTQLTEEKIITSLTSNIIYYLNQVLAWIYYSINLPFEWLPRPKGILVFSLVLFSNIYVSPFISLRERVRLTWQGWALKDSVCKVVLQLASGNLLSGFLTDKFASLCLICLSKQCNLRCTCGQRVPTGPAPNKNPELWLLNWPLGETWQRCCCIFTAGENTLTWWDTFHAGGERIWDLGLHFSRLCLLVSKPQGLLGKHWSCP